MSWSSWGTIISSLTAYLATTAAVVWWNLVGKHVLCWLQWYFCWVLEGIFAWVVPTLKFTLTYVGVLPTWAMSPVLQAWLFLNYWTPLNSALVMLFVCWLVISLLRIGRFVKQFIPTVAN